MGQLYQVPSVKRAFEIIELLAQHESGLSISGIHRLLALPLSSAATIVYTLHDLGYLTRDEKTSCYSLGFKMFGIARHALEHIDVAGHCHGLLQELVVESGLTGHLAVLRDGESVYVDRVQGNGLVQVSTYVGLHWPAHTSAAGKALLAFSPEPDLLQALKTLKLRRLTPQTLTSKGALEKQLRLFRRLGYTWEQNKGEMGLGCVAAPIYDLHHQVVAAVSLSGTTHQISKLKIPALGTLVKRYAQRMSARLGSHS